MTELQAELLLRQAARIEALEERVEALKTALREIANSHIDREDMQSIASAALAIPRPQREGGSVIRECTFPHCSCDEHCDTSAPEQDK